MSRNKLLWTALGTFTMVVFIVYQWYRVMQMGYGPSVLLTEEYAAESDTVYIVPERKLLILLSESRSGSTWVGTLFQQLEDLLYVFEPLDSRHYTQKKDHLTTEDSQLQILANLCTCKFQNSLQSFGKARGGNNPRSNIARYSLAKQVGMGDRHMEKFCSEFLITMAKCIRLQNLEILSKLPGLGCKNYQVIHLVRDPRAIIMSRIVTFHELYSGDGKKVSPKNLSLADIQKAANTLCTLGVWNYKVSQEDWIKDSYMNVRFEDLVYKPHKILEDMYRFIKRPITAELSDYMDHSMIGKSTSSDYKVIKNSHGIAAKWKTMNIERIRTVEGVCQEYMEIFNYEVYEP